MEAQGLISWISGVNKDVVDKFSTLLKKIDINKTEQVAKTIIDMLEFRNDGSVWLHIKLKDPNVKV